MKTGYFQFTPEFGNKEQNLQKIEEAVGSRESDLIILPELCTTGYQFCSAEEAIELAETIPDGETVKYLTGIAKQNNVYIIAGIAEIDGDKLYNTAVITGPEGFVGKYRKIHLFFEENLWFTPGDDLPEVYDINGVNVGVLICFDWIFPELFRILSLEGADLIALPANLVLPYCQEAMKTRSIENRIYVAVSNRTGFEERGGKDRLTFTGESRITDPKGNVLVSSSTGDEDFQTVAIDTEQARDKELNKYNKILESRRPEIYSKYPKL